MAKQTRKDGGTAALPLGGVLERDLVADVLLRLGQRSDTRLWRANVVSAMARNSDGSTRRVAAGTKGQGDLIGLVQIGECGIHLEVEVKRPGQKLRTEQEARKKIIEDFGGIFLRVTSADDAAAKLDAEIANMRGFLGWDS